MPIQKAVRVSTVDNALAVHTDLSQGNWSNLETMVSQAKYAGIDTLRVPVTIPDSWFNPFVHQLADSGLKLDLVVDPNHSPEVNARAIADYARAHPGVIDFVEGPNEPSNWGVNYGGKTGMEGARLWQNDFIRLMDADPATRDITIASPSSYIATDSDVINIHPYAHNGDQPRDWIRNDLRGMQAADPGKEFVITETGYYTLPGGNPAGVDDATQAKLIVNTYLDAMSLGARSVGFFSLKDWQNPDWDSFGLFYGDNTPKPSATALHNLEAILQDNGATAASFDTGSLDFANSVPADVNTMLMQKSSGEYVLALWREPDLWNQNEQKTVDVTSSSFTLRIGASAQYTVYDPLTGSTPIRQETSSTGLALTLSDHPVLVSFRPGAPGSGAAAPATQVAVATTIGDGPDTLVLKLSGDAWQENAKFTLKVDGVLVGGDHTAFASHAAGQTDTMTVKGSWGPGAHKVEVLFFNDGWSGRDGVGEDRNLYVEGITYNGAAVPSSKAYLGSWGPVEFAIPPGGPAEIVGDALDNVLTGTAGADVIRGLAGNDTLRGLGGNDRLEGGDGNDTLDGGAGIDTMIGGAGNDTYVVDNTGDVVVEALGGGNDRVLASVTYTLGANVERLELTGSAANGRGNALDNAIVGNGKANILYGMDGNDKLYGGDGDDRLVGGMGADILQGGRGADTFRWSSAAEGGDTVLDFQHGVDILDFSAGGFGGGLAIGRLDASQFASNVTGLADAPAGKGQFVWETDAAKLWWDVDGAGGKAAVLVATFSADAAVHASDIHLI